MPIQAIEPKRLYRQIAEQLRQLMASGEFQVGTRLPAERDLAIQLGVSRPSVREALIALEVEGIIEVRTGSGIYVKQAQRSVTQAPGASDTPADWGPLEVMSARILVESEVAALAAQNASKTDLKTIRAALQKCGRRPPRAKCLAGGRSVSPGDCQCLRQRRVARYGASLLAGAQQLLVSAPG